MFKNRKRNTCNINLFKHQFVSQYKAGCRVHKLHGHVRIQVYVFHFYQITPTPGIFCLVPWYWLELPDKVCACTFESEIYQPCGITGPGSSSGRASASGSGGRGFDTRPRHTKGVKNGTSGYLLWCSAL